MKPHKSLTEARVAEITAALATWLKWAEDERDRAAKGHALHASAATGFRVVDAYNRELKTGQPHCSCCQKPLMAQEGITAQQHGEFTDLLASVAKEQSVA